MLALSLERHRLLDDYKQELDDSQSQVLDSIFANLDRNVEAVNWLRTNMESREGLTV